MRALLSLMELSAWGTWCVLLAALIVTMPADPNGPQQMFIVFLGMWVPLTVVALIMRGWYLLTR